MNDQRFTPENVGRVVRWAVMLFFAFAILQHVPKFSMGEPPKKPAPVATQAEAATDKTESPDCAGSVFNNFSLFAMPLFPVSSPTISIADIKTGTGTAAACGQKVTLRYTYARRGGEVIFSNMGSGGETKDIIIGGGEMLPGFERGIVGMKTGGERDISIPPAIGFAGVKNIEALRDHEKFNFSGITDFLTARASLVSLAPDMPQNQLKLRLLEQSIGDGRPVECGDDASIHLTLWKMDGTSLYTNDTGEPLHFTLGRSQLPYGIEQGVIGMQPGGKRTLIMPPSYTAPLFDDSEKPLLKDVSIPANEILLAVVELLPEKPKTDTKPKDAAPEKK